MQPGKLTLREAMDLLYAKTEIDLEGDKVDNAKSVLQAHPVGFNYKVYQIFIFRQQVELVPKTLRICTNITVRLFAKTFNA